MNKVMLIGRLGANAEIKRVGDGKTVVNFRLATTEVWVDKDGNKREHTEWHRCVYWGERAARVGAFMAKGRLVSVLGQNRTRSYERDLGGQKVTTYTTEVKVDEVELLDKNPGPSAETKEILGELAGFEPEEL